MPCSCSRSTQLARSASADPGALRLGLLEEHRDVGGLRRAQQVHEPLRRVRLLTRLAHGVEGVVLSAGAGAVGMALGAASVHEAIYSLVMMRDGFLAGSANISTLDPRADRFPIVRESREARVDTVMSNSFGFGGTNASLVFGRI